MVLVGDEALGVPLGVAIDTAKYGVLAVGVVALGAKLVRGKTDGDAGAAAVGTGAFHEAGIDFIAQRLHSPLGIME